jgi:GH15 family glucan-1,4-alpha-glucosidase
VRRISRRYRPATLVLETEFETSDGAVRLVDFMPPGSDAVVRAVEGVRGTAAMRMELARAVRLRRDRAAGRPRAAGLTLAAGPDAVHLATPVATRGEDALPAAELAVAAGQRLPFALDWHPSHDGPPPPADAFRTLEATQRSWQAWSKRCTYAGDWAEPVLTSLVVLRGLGSQ